MVVRATLETADWRTHLDMEELVINARVQILVVGAVWRNYSIFQGQYCLYQSCYSGGSFKMADGRLH